MDKFEVIFGFYKTPDVISEKPFASASVLEGDKIIFPLDDALLELSTVGGIAKVSEDVVFADILKHPETQEVLRPRSQVCDGVYCQVKVIPPALPKREHPEGKTCSECVFWSKQKGVEVLNTVHKKFQDNQELQLYKEVIDQMSINHGAPVLTNENVGYCPRESSLCGDTTPACKEGFKSK